MKKIAVYPGTFDPITLGHLDVIKAAAEIFDEVVVAILTNPQKKPMFSEPERLAMINELVQETGIVNVLVVSFGGLTVELAKEKNAIAIIRGLRLVMDYESELDISFNNRQLANRLGIKVCTVFLPPLQEHIHIRSSTVRELLSFGQVDLGDYLPKTVLDFIKKAREV